MASISASAASPWRGLTRGEWDAAHALSGLLPQVIDKLTPDGGVPSQLNLGSLAGSLGKLLG